MKQPDIIAAFRSGNYDPITWAEVHSGPVAFAVSSDALRIDGVRVNVSARTAQACADALGCVLPTACIEDTIYANADIKIRAFPIPTGPDGSLAQTAAHSKRIDDELRAVGALPSQLVATVGKSWVICNALVSRPGFAANYGWIDSRALHESVTEDWRVYQPLGTRHNVDHFDYCVAPNTRVLTSDLRWVASSDVSIGQELIAFPEELGGCELQSSFVTSKTTLELDCYEIVTDRGSIVASGDHRWVVTWDPKPRCDRSASRKYETRAKKRWLRTEELLPTARRSPRIPDQLYLVQYVEPWSEDVSWDGGWMAGFLDGEGWVNQGGVGFGQNPGPLLDRACRMLETAGYRLSCRPNKSGCVNVYIGGGPPVSVLGRYRPIRLLSKARRLWEGRHPWGGRGRDANVPIREVRPLGKREVVGVGTTTKTFIAEGFLSHNSQTLRLVHRNCRVDGWDCDIRDVMTDPALALWVSHEGPLRITRQPGVGSNA